MKDQALQMCLEYIETDAHERRYVRHAIKQALAAPVQEPVAWMFPDDLKRFETSEAYAEAYSIKMGSPTQGTTVPLYTTPPAARRPWVGLTDEDFENAFQETYIMGDSDLQDFAKVIEAKLKEKNT